VFWFNDQKYWTAICYEFPPFVPDVPCVLMEEEVFFFLCCLVMSVTMDSMSMVTKTFLTLPTRRKTT
jgi:hypothetical protein